MTHPSFLNKDARHRLEELESQLEKESSLISKPEKLTTRDLWLLLSCSTVIQNAVRNAVGTAAGGHTLGRDAHSSDTDGTALHELSALKSQLFTANAEREKAISSLRQAESTIAGLRGDTATLKSQLTAAERARDIAQQEAHKLRGNGNWGSVTVILERLQQDDALSARLGLQGLADNAESAIKLVSVLSSLDGVKRFWQVLKEQADSRRSAPTASDKKLLATMLSWHNHNWSMKPYSLYEPAVGDAFDYSAHMRCSATPIGETIRAVWMPGLKDGGGKMLEGLKPVVETHD